MRVLGLRLEKPMRQMMAFIDFFAFMVLGTAIFAQWQSDHNVVFAIAISATCFILMIVCNVIMIKLFIRLKKNRIDNLQNQKKAGKSIQKFLKTIFVEEHMDYNTEDNVTTEIQNIIDKLSESDKIIIKQYIKKLEIENNQLKSDLSKEWDLK